MGHDEIISGLVVVLGAIAGGIIGFVAGGPAGAVVGIAVGAGVTAILSNLLFDTNGSSTNSSRILSLLTDALFMICGGAIGFVIGGPLGAVIGMVVGTGISLAVKNVSFSDETKSKRAGFDEGKRIGDNVAEGARKSLGVNSPSTEFQEIGNYTVQGYAKGLTNSLPILQEATSTLTTLIVTLFMDSSNQIISSFTMILTYLQTNFYMGASQALSDLAFDFKISLNEMLSDTERMLNSLVLGFNHIIDSYNRIKPVLALLGKGSVSVGYIGNIRLPRLATGAVIPPNREFMAVLGDQKSGTNIEAPLDTIVQAVMLALAKSGTGGGGQVIENVVNLDGEVIYRNQQKVSRRHGMSLANK